MESLHVFETFSINLTGGIILHYESALNEALFNSQKTFNRGKAMTFIGCFMLQNNKQVIELVLLGILILFLNTIRVG